MSDAAPEDQIIQTPPPSGDPQKAQKYLDTLMDLIDIDKLAVSHSDLRRYDPTSLQDHYRVRLEDFEVEVSHSKQPETGKNSYVMVFSNAKLVQDGHSQRIILAFTYLTEEQFQAFKVVAEEQLEREQIKIDEARFKEAMLPIDRALEKLLSQHFNDASEPEAKTSLEEPDLLAQMNLVDDPNPYSTSD